MRAAQNLGRFMETLELGDDVTGIEAATYSLGLGSAQKTHLDRLNDFGQEHGYEARQARRHSDKGLRQLSRLITSNWIVHTVPTLEVFMVQQSNGSFAVTLRTTRQLFVDMHVVTVHDVEGEAEGVPRRTPRNLDMVVERQPSTSGPPPRAAREVTTLATPLTLKALEPGRARHLRFEWRGEVWPRMVMATIGSISPTVLVGSHTLGGVMQLHLDRLPSATPERYDLERNH